MARAHFVKKARKDNPAVKAGESYWWWKFRYGAKRYSTSRPSRSQLTGSAFLSSLYALEDSILGGEIMNEDDAGELTAGLEEMADECQCSYDNMPYQLQDSSDAGMLLQERIDGLQDWITAIGEIDWENTAPDEAGEQIMDANPGIG